MVPQHDGWAALIEAEYGSRAKRVTRYAIKKEPHVFDEGKLLKLIDGLAPEYRISMIDEQLYYQCLQNDWSQDLVSVYENYESYLRLGIGVVVTKDGVPVSGASSYASYHEGIEVEIDTKEEYRRQGLASVCGAKLILECQKRNLYPSWDAQNPWSVRLAEKLGYHFDQEYIAYEIWGY